jgi:hypothetical protein
MGVKIKLIRANLVAGSYWDSCQFSEAAPILSIIIRAFRGLRSLTNEARSDSIHKNCNRGEIPDAEMRNWENRNLTALRRHWIWRANS